MLTAAGRYDRFALKNTPEGRATLNYVFDAFSPKASATYQILKAEDGHTSTLNVYGAYSHAFLPPRRPSSLTPANVDLNLQPENINNLEGGMKSSLFDGRVSLDGAYFWMSENGVVLTRRKGRSSCQRTPVSSGTRASNRPSGLPSHRRCQSS